MFKVIPLIISHLMGDIDGLTIKCNMRQSTHRWMAIYSIKMVYKCFLDMFQEYIWIEKNRADIVIQCIPIKDEPLMAYIRILSCR
jgi:hypothetical protein